MASLEISKAKRRPLPASAYVAWVTALLASATSIYFIEILHKPVATLCWVDRMFIFSLLLIFTSGIIYRDRMVWRYTIPILLIGLPVSFFQQLVHWDLIHLTPAACSVSVVCTTKYFDLFGFISQATLCFVAFVIVAVCSWRLSTNRS